MKKLFFLVIYVLWAQMTFGSDVSLITGTDASNVVVSGTSWTVNYKDGADGGNATQYQLSRVALYGSGADPVYVDNGNWIVGNYNFGITEFGGGIKAFVNTNLVNVPDFRPVIDAGGLLQITISDAFVTLGGGWSMSNLMVNGVLLAGNWGAVGTWGVDAPTETFYVDLKGETFQSISFNATLNQSDPRVGDGVAPRGDPLGIAISNVSVVPEPSSFILMVISGIAYLVLRKKPLHSS